MSTPLISVIIPVYNGERTVLETVQSILKQTFTNFELIIINDGSSDRTLELLEIVDDPRVRILSYENGGLPVARNRGIEQAQGQYITFIDADDLWTPTKLSDQLTALQNNPDAGLAYSWTLTMDDKTGALHPGKFVSFDGDVYGQMLLSNFIASGSNAMLTAEAVRSVGDFDATLTSCEDWDYWLRVASQWPFTVVPKPQILYRQSSSAMSSKVDVMEHNHMVVHHRAFQNAPAHLKKLESRSLANEYQFLAQLALTHVDNATALQVAWEKLGKAIQFYPPIIFSRKSITLMIKLVLTTVLSPTISNRLLKRLSQFRSLDDNIICVEE
ncbi:MAG: glycosyltransferase [Cyanobacteria bacterium P01_F01_bin.150]